MLDRGRPGLEMFKTVQINENNISSANMIVNPNSKLVIPELSNNFILDGNKVKLNLSSNTELIVQHSSEGGILSQFMPNFYKKSEIILVENIISLRSNDASQHLAASQSKQGYFKSFQGSYSGWLRLNQTLTINPTSPLKNKSYGLPDPSYKGGTLVLPSDYEVPAYQGCGTGLLIDYVKKDLSKQWKRKTLCFRHTDHQVVDAWRNKLDQAVSSVSMDRPRKLLIFVNPYGGRGEGKAIFYNKVVPLLRLSGVKFDVIVTERANQAKDMIKNCSLDGIDGIVCVGGDGMFSEVFTGLLLRTANETNGDFTNLRKGRLRVGVIPAGNIMHKYPMQLYLQTY